MIGVEFAHAVRLTEILLGFAFIVQALEHLSAINKGERLLFGGRLALSVMLMIGLFPAIVSAALLLTSFAFFYRFQGPYNGGSDRMGALILLCLTLVHVLPKAEWQQLALGYLALQLILSYVMAGWVKIVNPEWRSGLALQKVFCFSVYPVSEITRGWADYPKLLFVMSWAVMTIELFFPLFLLSQSALFVGLTLMALFHLANAVLFGLNRFFWVWLAAYPALLWLQSHLNYMFL